MFSNWEHSKLLVFSVLIKIKIDVHVEGIRVLKMSDFPRRLIVFQLSNGVLLISFENQH